MASSKKVVAQLVGSGEVGGFQKPNPKVLGKQAQQKATHDITLAKEREQKQFQKIKEEEVARVKETEPQVQES